MQDSGFDNPSLRPIPVDSGAVEQKKIIPSLDIQAGTVASDKHPDRNEDAMFILPEKRATGVFDGLGGHPDGDKASRIARDQVDRALQGLDAGLNLQQTEDAIRQAITNADNTVYKQPQTELSTMCTTASVVYIWVGGRGEKKAIVGNVGDSRVYLLRNGGLEQITLDDSPVRLEMLNEQEARQLQSKLNNVTDPQRELNERERTLFNLRNQVTQVLGQPLGQPSTEPRLHTIDLLRSDKLLVCSDGISDNLTDNEIQQVLKESPNSTEAVNALISAAQARSRSNHSRAKPDDMTAVVIGEAQSFSGVPK